MKELIEKLEKDFYEGLDKIKPHIVGHTTATNLILDSFKQAIQALSQSEGESKIDKAIKTFEETKSKATSLRDTIYLDGVLAILDTIKNEPLQTK